METFEAMETEAIPDTMPTKPLIPGGEDSKVQLKTKKNRKKEILGMQVRQEEPEVVPSNMDIKCLHTVIVEKHERKRQKEAKTAWWSNFGLIAEQNEEFLADADARTTSDGGLHESEGSSSSEGSGSFMQKDPDPVCKLTIMYGPEDSEKVELQQEKIIVMPAVTPAPLMFHYTYITRNIMGNDEVKLHNIPYVGDGGDPQFEDKLVATFKDVGKPNATKLTDVELVELVDSLIVSHNFMQTLEPGVLPPDVTIVLLRKHFSLDLTDLKLLDQTCKRVGKAFRLGSTMLKERYLTFKMPKDAIEPVEPPLSTSVQNGCHCRGKCIRSKICPCINNGVDCSEQCADCKCTALKIDVSTIEGAGYGVFAVSKVAKDELVAEYCGEIISTDEAARRELIYSKLRCSYTFAIDDETVIDGTRYGNVARFINHSKKPNCIQQFLSVKEKRIGIYASKRISPGKELFLNYGYDPVTIYDELNGEEPTKDKPSKSKAIAKPLLL